MVSPGRLLAPVGYVAEESREDRHATDYQADEVFGRAVERRGEG